MSAQDNKQLVMQGYQLFGKKDIQGLLALYADDVDWVGYESDLVPFAGSWHGKEGVAEFFRQLDQTQEALRFEPQAFIAEDDKVVVTGQAAWLVKATGKQYQYPWVHVFTIRDGKVARFEHYNDTAATEAAFRAAPGSQPQQEAPLRH